MNTLQQAAAAMEDGPLDTQKLVRILLESALNAIMDEQADMACEGGANSRNGYRERGLLTPAGDITLSAYPKLRCGHATSPTDIMERYSRVGPAPLVGRGGRDVRAPASPRARSRRWRPS